MGESWLETAAMLWVFVNLAGLALAVPATWFIWRRWMAMEKRRRGV